MGSVFRACTVAGGRVSWIDSLAFCILSSTEGAGLFPELLPGVLTLKSCCTAPILFFAALTALDGLKSFVRGGWLAAEFNSAAFLLVPRACTPAGDSFPVEVNFDSIGIVYSKPGAGFEGNELDLTVRPDAGGGGAKVFICGGDEAGGSCGDSGKGPSPSCEIDLSGWMSS